MSASSDATPSIDSRSSQPRRLDSESFSDASLSTSGKDDGLSTSTVEVKQHSLHMQNRGGSGGPAGTVWAGPLFILFTL